jgi:TolB-like protein
MKQLRILSLLALALLLAQGCAPKNSAVVNQQKQQKEKSTPKVVSNKVSNYSVNIATTTTIKDTVDKIAQQLVDTLKVKDVGAVAITSFVDLHQLNKTTHFGRVLGESLFNELYKRGVNVMDFRGQKSLTINANGEFFLSRNVKKLHSPIQNKYVLVGTYTKIAEGVLINSRIVDNKNGKVIATSRVIFHSKDCRIFENCKKPKPEPVVPIRTIDITTDGCATEKCPYNCVDNSITCK